MDIDIHRVLERQYNIIFKKVKSIPFHPLRRPFILIAKKVQYSLRWKSTNRPKINTERCKQTFIN